MILNEEKAAEEKKKQEERVKSIGLLKTDDVARAKKIKKLKKTLRQIEELKKKQKENIHLEPAQLVKLDTEPSVLDMLRQLEL